MFTDDRTDSTSYSASMQRELLVRLCKMKGGTTLVCWTGGSMSQEFTRRRFVKHISAAGLLSLVVGEPSWLFADEDQRWKDISKLDGSLLLDEGNREQMAMDLGAIFHRLPAAVLKPRSSEDLVKIIRFANTHRMQVVMRGQGHSQ